MILAIPFSLNEIVDFGPDFSWPRPSICRECGGSGAWGHGFVTAFFDETGESVCLRLYRCPECRSVHRLRPAGYFRRFQASVSTIRSSIATRLQTGRWPPGISRSRAGHWLRSLKQKTAAHLGQGWLGERLLEAFDRLIFLGKIPVSRSFKAVLKPGETYPIEECRCAEVPCGVAGPASHNQEAFYAQRHSPRDCNLPIRRHSPPGRRGSAWSGRARASHQTEVWTQIRHPRLGQDSDNPEHDP